MINQYETDFNHALRQANSTVRFNCNMKTYLFTTLTEIVLKNNTLSSCFSSSSKASSSSSTSATLPCSARSLSRLSRSKPRSSIVSLLLTGPELNHSGSSSLWYESLLSLLLSIQIHKYFPFYSINIQVLIFYKRVQKFKERRKILLTPTYSYYSPPHHIFKSFISQAKILFL